MRIPSASNVWIHAVIGWLCGLLMMSVHECNRERQKKRNNGHDRRQERCSHSTYHVHITAVACVMEINMKDCRMLYSYNQQNTRTTFPLHLTSCRRCRFLSIANFLSCATRSFVRLSLSLALFTNFVACVMSSVFARFHRWCVTHTYTLSFRAVSFFNSSDMSRLNDIRPTPELLLLLLLSPDTSSISPLCTHNENATTLTCCSQFMKRTTPS